MQSLCILARVAGGSIKPGVERSGTPGSLGHQEEPAKWATAVYQDRIAALALSHASRARFSDPSSTWGFASLQPQALCFHPLRGFLKGELAQTCSEVPEVCRTLLTLDRRLEEDRRAALERRRPIA